jgi:hypothetical protein
VLAALKSRTKAEAQFSLLAAVFNFSLVFIIQVLAVASIDPSVFGIGEDLTSNGFGTTDNL